MRLARNVETRPAWAGNVSCGMCGLTAQPAFAIKHKTKVRKTPLLPLQRIYFRQHLPLERIYFRQHLPLEWIAKRLFCAI